MMVSGWWRNLILHLGWRRLLWSAGKFVGKMLARTLARFGLETEARNKATDAKNEF